MRVEKDLEPKRSYSGYRIAQTAWFVTSAYFAFLIVEVTTNALSMAVFSSSLDMARLWIIVPTISLYFISSAEAYLWLNPRGEEPIAGSTAGFRGILLFLYIWAVVAHALLVFPCSESGITNAQAFYYWLFGFGTVTFTYSLYNAVWLIKIFLVKLDYVSDDKEGPDLKNAIKYTVYYFGFSLLSVVLGLVVREKGLFYSAELMTFVLFSLYVVTYFVIWWKVWHQPALSVASEQLFGVRQSSAPDHT